MLNASEDNCLFMCYFTEMLSPEFESSLRFITIASHEIITKLFVGLIPSDKVADVYFSGVGNLLCTIDTESMSRVHLNFWMITKVSNEDKVEKVVRNVMTRKTNIGTT